MQGHTALTFLPLPALRSIGIPTIFKNTGTCAFQLALCTLRPSTPPRSCQLRGPHAAGSTLSLGQHPVPGGWSGFCHSEMIWTITEAMQVGIGFLAPPPCLQNKNLLWGRQTLVADPMVTPLRSWRVTHTSECFSHKKKKKAVFPLRYALFFSHLSSYAEASTESLSVAAKGSRGQQGGLMERTLHFSLLTEGNRKASANICFRLAQWLKTWTLRQGSQELEASLHFLASFRSVLPKQTPQSFFSLPTTV